MSRHSICYDIIITNEIFDFFGNVFSSEDVRVCCIITIYIQSYAVSSYLVALMKIYYIQPTRHNKHNSD